MFSVIRLRRVARRNEQRERHQVQRHRAPRVGDQRVVPADAEIPVAREQHVLGVGVELLERLRAVQEQVQEHGVGHQLGDLPDGGILDFEAREAPQQLQHHQQNRRAGAEGRGQKLRRQDRAVPVRPRRQPVVQERGHGVDAHRHGNAEQHQRHHQLFDVVLAVERAIQDVRGHRRNSPGNTGSAPARPRPGCCSGSCRYPNGGIRCQKRSGRPISTSTNSRHMVMALMASSSP